MTGLDSCFTTVLYPRCLYCVTLLCWPFVRLLFAYPLIPASAAVYCILTLIRLGAG